MNKVIVTFTNPLTSKSADLVADSKVFSTGSTGYWAGGKIELDSQRYQVSANIVLIGSKPK